MDQSRRRLWTTVWAVLWIVPFATSAAAQTQTRANFLETRASFPLMQGPQHIVVGDFNHDGKMDLAITSILGTNQVSVLLGNGDGTFQPMVNYYVGGRPESIAVADLRHTGNLDLVVGDSIEGVSVLLGNGDGTFRTAQRYATPASPLAVEIGDVNGDHIPDIVAFVETPHCHCLVVLKGNGDGTFQEPPITTAPSFPASEIGIGDFDGDGKLDVATAGCFFTSCEVNIMLGNGDGTFRQGASYPVDGGGSYLFPVVVADLRGNGKLDLALTYNVSSVAVLLGNGDGTFEPPATYSANDSALVGAADVNGDGKIDLLVISGSGSPALPPDVVGVLVGNGDGTFQPEFPYAVGKSHPSAAVGDFNGDHHQDLAVLDDLESNVFILLNTGVVSFSPTTPLAFSPQLLGTTSASQGVILSNNGTTALAISSISVQNAPPNRAGVEPAAQALNMTTNCGKSVPVGGNCKLSVSFTPETIGPQGAIISIVDSASSKPQVIELTGAGTVVSFLPTQLSFPPQPVNTKSSPLPVHVTNTGNTALTFNWIAFGGRDFLYFSQKNTCGSQIGPGANCTIWVSFEPQQQGLNQALLEINDDGGGTQFVPLSGTGTS